jgi:hypothetical protein
MQLALNGDATWGEACRAAWQHVNSGMMMFWSQGHHDPQCVCLAQIHGHLHMQLFICCQEFPNRVFTQTGIHQLQTAPASYAAESVLTGHWRTLLPVQRLPDSLISKAWLQPLGTCVVELVRELAYLPAALSG